MLRAPDFSSFTGDITARVRFKKFPLGWRSVTGGTMQYQ